uniref:Uncharacterized protein n=1 Tax=Rhizophora mucronata TaxID=61149 RepID=A0A2P2NN53_RHIMU
MVVEKAEAGRGWCCCWRSSIATTKINCACKMC